MKYYITELESGNLVSTETEAQMLKMFPDGLTEVSSDVAKEFSRYNGTHNCSYDTETKTCAWTEIETTDSEAVETGED